MDDGLWSYLYPTAFCDVVYLGLALAMLLADPKSPGSRALAAGLALEGNANIGVILMKSLGTWGPSTQ